MVEDKKKELVRTEEAKAAADAEQAAKEALGLKKAKLAEFEEKKKEVDLEVTKKFDAMLPEYTPKAA
jgi:hypothetical protein